MNRRGFSEYIMPWVLIFYPFNLIAINHGKPWHLLRQSCPGISPLHVSIAVTVKNTTFPSRGVSSHSETFSFEVYEVSSIGITMTGTEWVQTDPFSPRNLPFCTFFFCWRGGGGSKWVPIISVFVNRNFNIGLNGTIWRDRRNRFRLTDSSD